MLAATMLGAGTTNTGTPLSLVLALALIAVVPGVYAAWVNNRSRRTAAVTEHDRIAVQLTKVGAEILQEEIQALRAERSRMRVQVREEADALRAEVAAIRAENDRFRTDLVAVRARMADLSEKLAHAQLKVDVYEREIKRLIAKLPDEDRASNRAVANIKTDLSATRGGKP